MGPHARVLAHVLARVQTSEHTDLGNTAIPHARMPGRVPFKMASQARVSGRVKTRGGHTVVSPGHVRHKPVSLPMCQKFPLAVALAYTHMGTVKDTATLPQRLFVASPSTIMMKGYRGKLPLSIITVTLCGFAFLALLYTERLSFLSSSSFLKSKSCARRTSAVVKAKDETAEKNLENPELDDRFEFDPEECDITRGKWVFNRSIKPLYTDRSCPYVDRQFSCVKNGRLDLDYRHWEWQPDDCYLPRFDPEVALEKLRGKRLVFAGDSLQRSQWESFVCMIEWTIPPQKKSMKRGKIRNVFKAK
ncbi:hypothetical protein Gotri_002735, partial [Gossypium trilobum]|nr:hypothetical protein [Gossypium trilobum]